jgi:hypothetical protein
MNISSRTVEALRQHGWDSIRVSDKWEVPVYASALKPPPYALSPMPQALTTVVEYPELSRREIEHYVDLGLKKFYFRPTYIVKFLVNTRSLPDLYRKIRGFKNFVSYLIGR